MASVQSSDSFDINSDNYTVVKLDNGELLQSEDGNIFVQNRFTGNLCTIKPTNIVLNEFNITLSEKEDTDDIEQCQSAPSLAIDHVEPVASLSTNPNNQPCDGNVPNKRGKWSKNAILMLINLRIEHNTDFTSTTQKNDVTWKLISNKMKANGFEMTPTQCNDKWRYLKGKYTAAKDNRGDKGSGEEPVDFPYYQIMDEFLGKKHNIKPIAVASSIRGDTVPNENAAGSTDALQEDGDQDVSNEASLEAPRKKMKMEIVPRVKQNKTGLCSVWDEMKNSRGAREQSKERRHQELLNVRNRAIDVFSEKMDQFIEKCTK
ncbi:unnamed protein product [Ceutorhynchus assimilis]|uniref:Myb/SANT-like DNA-binding domain-containing protein n=1 Tax=Ceutorhynchus assimilis TaxID=467358 RepID=A0A9N9MJJ0_9CUCU|nr:unnamed protein product [Ceutorhynchus assimilis]